MDLLIRENVVLLDGWHIFARWPFLAPKIFVFFRNARTSSAAPSLGYSQYEPILCKARDLPQNGKDTLHKTKI